MQCNTPGLCLIRARGTAARIIRHRRRNNFDKSEYGSAIREFPAGESGKEGLSKGHNSFPIMRKLLILAIYQQDVFSYECCRKYSLMSGCKSRKGRGEGEESELRQLYI